MLLQGTGASQCKHYEDYTTCDAADVSNVAEQLLEKSYQPDPAAGGPWTWVSGLRDGRSSKEANIHEL